ncbi:hypothetical protein [Candidatus Vampirococcus lugosii]|uniref:Transglycosylase SLT domain-containing protein n=1 Tax=Candidatus Vampirococcus lugosii TaxID=2789015 RepID=A0ABS5QKT5_9BACT|nr:hypothetical protein [Candidatus Vampirococcus lugosii]MBS8121843.1 hypothetical protein [Candidatus Vampirococcus lugosii]
MNLGLKYIFYLVIFMFLTYNFGYTYQPDLERELKVRNSVDIIKNNIINKDLSKLNEIREKIDIISEKFSDNNKITYLIMTRIQVIQSEIENREYNNKFLGYEFKKSFIETHGQEILTAGYIPQLCLENYDIVDKVAKERDFPTALIISIWYRESSCRKANPANGFGPFQITSHYHKPGEISSDEFITKIHEFIDFAEHKMNHFSNNPKLKDIYGHEVLQVNYNNFDMRSIKLLSVLYSGLVTGNSPTTSYYANANLNSNFESTRDGVITLFIKILEWELQNKI